MPKRKNFTTEYLHKLESEASRIAYYSRDIQALWENPNSRLNQIRDMWERAMEQLRGWSNYADQTTKPEWKEHCDKCGLAYDYSFSDLLA